MAEVLYPLKPYYESFIMAVHSNFVKCSLAVLVFVVLDSSQDKYCEANELLWVRFTTV